MSLMKRNRPSPAMIVAAIALCFALAGTAIAADPVGKLTKAKVKSIARKQADKELRANISGSHVNLADTATNANNLGGQAAANYLRANACQSGSVLGFARVNGDNGIPATYTSNPAFISITRNCSGGTVEVRRSSLGHFLVRFNGNPAALAVATANTDESVIGENNIMAVGKVGGGADAGAFNVTVANEPSNTFEDADFTIVLP